MAAAHLKKVLHLCGINGPKMKNLVQTNLATKRSVVTTESGSFLQQPTKQRFGLTGVFVTVLAGLTVGSGISRSFASFLEENDLFVPSDDDDDD